MLFLNLLVSLLMFSSLLCEVQSLLLVPFQLSLGAWAVSRSSQFVAVGRTAGASCSLLAPFSEHLDSDPDITRMAWFCLKNTLVNDSALQNERLDKALIWLWLWCMAYVSLFSEKRLCDGERSSMVQRALSMCEALGSVPSTPK